MIIKPRYKKQIKCILLLSIILASLVSALIFPTILSNLYPNSENSGVDSNKLGTDSDPNEEPNTSVLGNATWWNTDYEYRRIISVTNQHTVNVSNYGVNVTFNYAELEFEGDNLEDLRIVENDIERKYYVVKDYPQVDYATVWFDTNITEGPANTEQDTYMYYGNPSYTDGQASGELDSFGWVKNGDFELDIPVDLDDPYIPDGWIFSEDPLDEVRDEQWWKNNEEWRSEQSDLGYGEIQNILYKYTESEGEDDTIERVGQGTYAYKWGADQNILLQPQILEFCGTFYSYPFTVPIIEGGDLGLHIYRNIRTYDFDDKKSDTGEIEKDGYYLRLCNGTDAKYTYEVDDHEDITDAAQYDNYIEVYGGNKKWKVDNVEQKDALRKSYDLPDTDIETKSDEIGVDGNLTGNIIFDISAYEGDEIFLEQGSWGKEERDLRKKRCAIFQLDDVRFNYTLITAELEEGQAQVSNLEIRARDVDGRLVPNVEIFLFNNSEEEYSGIATDGKKTFTDLPRGNYSITVNYTLASGEVVEVFNSSESGIGPYYWNGINYTLDIVVDLWTIDFEVVDWDLYPLGSGDGTSLGYISIAKNRTELELGNELINLTLNGEGKATFRWWNRTEYYYQIYYDNADYSNSWNPTPLNKSYISRSTYDPGEKEYTKTFDVNKTNTDLGMEWYKVSERIYTQGSTTDFINKKIIKADITLSNMEHYLEDLAVYYIDKDNETETASHLIYEKDYDPGDSITDDLIELDIMTVDNAKLQIENYEAYGLLIKVNGRNFTGTNCNGQIKIDTIETCNIYNITKLARLDITLKGVTQTGEIDVFAGRIIVSDNNTGQLIIEYIVNYDSGYHILDSSDNPFWYERGRVYNFSVDSGTYTGLNFNVTDPFSVPKPQWRPTDNVGIPWYNFTLDGDSSLIFIVIPTGVQDPYSFDTIFYNSTGMTEVFWMENLTFSVNFNKTEDKDVIPYPDAVTPGDDPGAYCELRIYLSGSQDLLIKERLDYFGNGNYSITFNSSRISAGYDQEFYTFILYGIHPTIDSPTPESFTVKVNAIPTGKSVHDYEDNYALKLNEKFDVIYQDFLNISIRYYILDNDDLLDNAALSYHWYGFGPASIPINIDPDNPDYFTFLLDSADSPSADLREIIITALLENYTMQTFDINIDINPKLTKLNGKINPLSVDWKVWVKDAMNYSLSYTDANTGANLDDAHDYTYEWYVGGDRVDDGELIKNADGTYTLDFDTETRTVGDYIIKVELEQENYEDQDLEIRLEIMLRTFDADLDADNYEDDQVTVVHGKKIKLELTLIDESRGIPLSGATVELDIGGKKYEFDDDGNGDYTLTFETDDLDAFFTSKTMTGEITIEKVDFVSDEIDITFVVTMEEIFDGMPTFYFIMIVSAISAAAGSLVGYRVIQQARIPKHVKKILLIKKKIKARDSIPSISIPTKEQMIMKQFGGAWKDLDLSLEDTLGIKEVKSKIPAEGKKSLKQKGGEE